MFGIIGGTGVYDVDLLERVQLINVSTPYGDVQITSGYYQGKPVAFLPRHGKGHATPPHRINYLANIWALREYGVTSILSTAAVGSIKKDYAPGTLVAVDDFMDFTKSRPQTFHEGQDGVVHVDMTEPYCPRLRKALMQSAGQLSIRLEPGGTYVCTEGPRFETKAEIRAYAAMGGDLVGMTSVPEVILAREAEICYATVAIVTNYCSGVSNAPLTVQEVKETMAQNILAVRQLFFQTIADASDHEFPHVDACSCRIALQEKGAL